MIDTVECRGDRALRLRRTARKQQAEYPKQADHSLSFIIPFPSRLDSWSTLMVSGKIKH
jgi:hypothetical protein